MAAESEVKLVGNITKDPEIRFTKSGQAVLSFSIAVNRRWQNRQTQEWEEKVSFVDCVAWQQIAENLAASVQKGDRLIISGRVDQQTWDDKETNAKRSKLEVVVEEVGASLKYAEAVITKNPKNDFNNGPSERNQDSGSSVSNRSSDDEPF